MLKKLYYLLKNNRMRLIVKPTLILALLFFSLKTNGQSVIGKNFEVMISETCVEMSDGVYMIETYKIFAFKKDTVNVVNRTNSYNGIIDTSKTYKWKIIGKEIKIEGFNKYKKIIWLNNKLTATDFYDNEISFKENEFFSIEAGE